MTTANPFFKVIEENMRAEAAKFGYELIYLGCDNDVSKQQQQMQFNRYQRKIRANGRQKNSAQSQRLTFGHSNFNHSQK